MKSNFSWPPWKGSGLGTVPLCHVFVNAKTWQVVWCGILTAFLSCLRKPTFYIFNEHILVVKNNESGDSILVNSYSVVWLLPCPPPASQFSPLEQISFTITTLSFNFLSFSPWFCIYFLNFYSWKIIWFLTFISLHYFA